MLPSKGDVFPLYFSNLNFNCRNWSFIYTYTPTDKDKDVLVFNVTNEKYYPETCYEINSLRKKSGYISNNEI